MTAIRSKLAAGGSVVIPAEYRRRLGMNVANRVVMHLEQGESRIGKLERAIRPAQDAVRRYVLKGDRLSASCSPSGGRPHVSSVHGGSPRVSTR